MPMCSTQPRIVPDEKRTDRWTSRRRLLTALHGGVPDRVPVNTYEMAGYDSRCWYNRQPSYTRLMDAVRRHSDCIAMWRPVVGDPVADAGYGSLLCSAYRVPMDVRSERSGNKVRKTRMIHTPCGDLQQVVVEDSELLTEWVVEHWCKSVDDVDTALSIPYQPPSADVIDASDYPRIRSEVGEHGITMACATLPAVIAADLMSFEDFTVWCYQHTEHFARCVDVVAERVIENLSRELTACTVDLYRVVGPEYFTPPYVSPELFGRFVVPHATVMTRMIHEHGGAVRLHCHGKIGRVLDLMLETGADGLDPCEPPPDGDIALDEAKSRCAERGVSVFGNIESKLLENGSAAQVRAEVRRVMAQAREGGGFVLMPTAAPIHSRLPATVEANYLAFIEAGLEFGAY